MTDKQADTKTYNCVYCNKTLTKFETQPLYKDGEFLTTCEECWYKHAKEAGHVVSDVQTINITIDDLINGNLRDMEFTAQFSVYKQAVKVLAEQLKAKEQECEKWKKETEQLQEELAISIQENEEGREINAELKAENEELKKWLPIVTRLEVAFGSIETEKAKAIDYNTYAVEIFRKLDQLEKENKELRQLLSKEPLALQALQHAYSSYKKSTDEFYKMAKDYKQALTEIKEIAEKQYHTKLVDKDCINCDESFAQILQKCEVLDDI